MTSRAILPAFLFGFLFFFFEDVLAVPIFFDAFAELFAIRAPPSHYNPVKNYSILFAKSLA
jgi:hypothetical protein